jgi:hypothetical protein
MADPRYEVIAVRDLREMEAREREPQRMRLLREQQLQEGRNKK